MNRPPALTRRDWIAAVLGSAAAPAVFARNPAAPGRLKVAAVVTECSYRSHAHVILENFLEPYYFNGKLTDSGADIVAIYADQRAGDRDLLPVIEKEYRVPVYPTIAEALRRGGKSLAVDAVLSIGEHGNYPRTDRGQIMYPRKRFFDEIVAVFRADDKVVPLFSDKHLSYRADWADEMVRTARKMKIPFMAGSSVPLAQRIPPLELPEGRAIEEAISIHGGPAEIYDFHALEVLQSMVESRKGGETGVKEVRLIEGDDVWKAGDQGLWSPALAEAAMRTAPDYKPDSLRNFVEPEDGRTHPIHAILVTYRDGLRAAVLRAGKSSIRWCFACRFSGESKPVATRFHVGPWQNRNLFKALSHAIQTHFREGRAPYPVERTQLVTGVLAAAMDSRFEKHRAIETPRLDVSYRARDYRAMRETGETWKIITEDMPQPPGIDPGGPRPKKQP